MPWLPFPGSARFKVTGDGQWAKMIDNSEANFKKRLTAAAAPAP